MSLDQLISSYLLSQIKHMQQENNTKSQGGKEAIIRVSPHPVTQRSYDF